MSDDSTLDASEIEVEVKGSEVVLTGTVSSREDKRRAEDLAEAISGVKNVENRLRVSKENESTSKMSAQQDTEKSNSNTTGAASNTGSNSSSSSNSSTKSK